MSSTFPQLPRFRTIRGEISEAVICRHLMAKKLAEKAFRIFSPPQPTTTVGKPMKVARCAAARKLLHIAWAVVKKGQPFDPNYTLKQQPA